MKHSTMNTKRLKFKKVADVKHPRTWLFYGKAGSGKTTLAATFPKPALIVDVNDRGTDSVSDVKDLKVHEIDNFDSFEDLYWYLRKHPDEFKTIIIDTITQLQTMLVNEVADKKHLKDKMAGDWGTLTKGDWGTIAARMKIWTTHYRDLGCEVVFICQDRDFASSDDNSIDASELPDMGPAVSPSVKSHLCACVDVIGNTLIRKRVKTKKLKSGKTKEVPFQEYSLRLGPSDSYITKCRNPREVGVPEFLSNPTYERLIGVIKGGLDG